MAERRSGAAAELTLAIGDDDAVPHDAIAGRSGLASGFARGQARRDLPGGWSVDLPLDFHTGEVSWMVLRTRATDRQLCAASQRRGTVRIRPQGTGAGLPQQTVPVVVTASLTVSGAQLSVWTVTATKAGPIDDSAQ